MRGNSLPVERSRLEEIQETNHGDHGRYRRNPHVQTGLIISRKLNPYIRSRTDLVPLRRSHGDWVAGPLRDAPGGVDGHSVPCYLAPRTNSFKEPSSETDKEEEMTYDSTLRPPPRRAFCCHSAATSNRHLPATVPASENHTGAWRQPCTFAWTR